MKRQLKSEEIFLNFKFPFNAVVFRYFCTSKLIWHVSRSELKNIRVNRVTNVVSIVPWINNC